MKAYNQATAFFRKMELSDPSDPRWKKFADAMDEAAVLIDCYKPMEEVERTQADGYKKGTTNL